MNFNSFENRRRRCMRLTTNKNLRESFQVELNNKWLSLTGVALFWEV